MKEFYGNIEYSMSKAMADYYLKSRKGNDAKMHPQKYLCNVVNTDFGIKGNCVEVKIVG